MTSKPRQRKNARTYTRLSGAERETLQASLPARPSASVIDTKLHLLAKELGALDANGNANWYELARRLAVDHEPVFHGAKSLGGRSPTSNTPHGYAAAEDLVRLIDSRLEAAKKSGRGRSVKQECDALAAKPASLPQFYRTAGKRKEAPASSKTLQAHYREAKRWMSLSADVRDDIAKLGAKGHELMPLSALLDGDALRKNLKT